MPSPQGLQFPFLGTFTRVAVIAQAGSTAADAWVRVQRNPQCLREVDLLRIRSELDALDLLPGNVYCLILQVAEQDGPRRQTREKSGNITGFGWQGATLRHERVASFGTGSGQWKPSSSLSTALPL